MSLRTMSNAGLYLFWAALAGCYAQVEDTDVAYVQSSICGAGPGCAGNNAPVTFTSNFVPPVTVNLGNAGLLTSRESRQGPITFKGELFLNQTVVTMTAPNDGNFNGLRTVDLRAAVGNDNCAQLSSTCQSVASYDSSRDGVAQKRLVLRGSGTNLLDLADSARRVSVYVRATGNAPAAPTWNADLELDLAMKARGGFP